MPSLRQILAAHAPVLLLDAASSRIQAGLFSGASEARWACSEEGAGVGLFRCIETLGAAPEGIGAFLFCEGPGSVLGLRTAAMALRVWCGARARPVFGYFSLAVVAEALRLRGATVIADARRERWHAWPPGGPLARVPAAELSGRLLMPEGFRHWSPAPAALESTPYLLAELFPRVLDAELFRPLDSPDAFLPEEPRYATWNPEVHRAP